MNLKPPHHSSQPKFKNLNQTQQKLKKNKSKLSQIKHPQTNNTFFKKAISDSQENKKDWA